MSTPRDKTWFCVGVSNRKRLSSIIDTYTKPKAGQRRRAALLPAPPGFLDFATCLTTVQLISFSICCWNKKGTVEPKIY